jgi:pimeloyl-ACP methyl ester carboxylesterase
MTRNEGWPDLGTQVEHGYVDAAGVRLHYAALGDGPLMLLIHGFPDFWFTWRHQMPALAEDYRVVAFDLRGYNLSDKPRGLEGYDLRVLVGDVETVIRHFDFTRAIIVGHDWGGAVGWATAALRPDLVEKLIVLNLPHPRCLVRELVGNPEQQAASAYARAFQEEGAHLTLTLDDLCAWITNDEARERHREALRRSDHEAMLNYYKRNYPRAPYQESDWMRIKVRSPVLIIHGLRDPYLLPGALSGTWECVEADLTLVTLPTAGHWVHHDAADFVTRTIGAWLKR